MNTTRMVRGKGDGAFGLEFDFISGFENKYPVFFCSLCIVRSVFFFLFGLLIHCLSGHRLQ